MGNCGTREENAVVAAHAQGILSSLPSDFLGSLVGGTLDLRLVTSDCIEIGLMDCFSVLDSLGSPQIVKDVVFCCANLPKMISFFLSVAITFDSSVFSECRFCCKIRFFWRYIPNWQHEKYGLH